jgi:UDP-glucuronate 4-epimerase
MTTYLLTGAAGFIGSHLAKALLSRGASVVGVDDFNDFYDPGLKRRNVAPFLEAKAFRLREGDIRSLPFLRELFRRERFDAVLHLAARAGVRPSLKDPLLYEETNVRGTLNLLECAREFSVKKFLFASSSSVYGNRKEVPFREDMNVDFPISPYAATKKAGELLCFNTHHLYGMDVTCLRYFTVYGPAQRPDMAIRKFTEALLSGRSIVLYGDGSSERDYTYVDDAVHGTLRALEHMKGFHVYNIGESRTISLKSLAALIERAVGTKAKIEWQPHQPGDVERTYADISLARREIGYDPKISLEEGVERTVAWCRGAGLAEGGPADAEAAALAEAGRP